MAWGGGDVVVELDINIADWLEIVCSEEVTLDGEGYSYYGEPFQDRWHFSGGLEGDLQVTYDSCVSPGDPGDGWLGSPRSVFRTSPPRNMKGWSGETRCRSRGRLQDVLLDLMKPNNTKLM